MSNTDLFENTPTKTQRDTTWIELRSEQGYRKFGEVLTVWGIPHQPLEGNLDEMLPPILDDLLQNGEHA